MGLFDKVKTSLVSSSLIAPFKSVQRCRYEEGDSTPFHAMSFFHAILTLDGEAFFQERGKAEFLCSRGTFFTIPAGVSYKWRIAKKTTLLQCLHDPFSFVEHRGLANLFGVASKHLYCIGLDESSLASFLRSFEEDESRREPAKGLFLSADWLKVLASAAAVYNAQDCAKHPALVRAMNFLQENAEREVSLEALAKRSGLGVSRLSQLFRESVGMSPLRYLSLLKAERATTLLVVEGLSAGEIADRLGFASASAFRRFYKRQTGIPPGRAANRKTGL